MRLINETSYDSKIIKPFIQNIVKAEGLKHSEYVIHLVNRRGKYNHSKLFSGYAYLTKIWWEEYKIFDKYYIKMKLPINVFDAEGFFKVMVHELAHTRGLKHREMMHHSKIEVPGFVQKFNHRGALL